MDTRTIALILIVVFVFLLFITIGFKIKSERKRRSFTNSSSERDKNINADNYEVYNGKIKPHVKKPFFAGIPSWGLALLIMLLAFVFLMVVSDIFAMIFRISEDNAVGEWVFYVLYNLIIAVGCFFICRQNPKSILYVPVLCNIIGIISAIVERNFWISSLWIVICSGWVLSIIASIIGAQSGRKKVISVNK
jgi:hypothetical protein